MNRTTKSCSTYLSQNRPQFRHTVRRMLELASPAPEYWVQSVRTGCRHSMQIGIVSLSSPSPFPLSSFSSPFLLSSSSPLLLFSYIPVSCPSSSPHPVRFSSFFLLEGSSACMYVITLQMTYNCAQAASPPPPPLSLKRSVVKIRPRERARRESQFRDNDMCDAVSVGRSVEGESSAQDRYKKASRSSVGLLISGYIMV